MILTPYMLRHPGQTRRLPDGILHILFVVCMTCSQELLRTKLSDASLDERKDMYFTYDGMCTAYILHTLSKVISFVLAYVCSRCVLAHAFNLSAFVPPKFVGGLILDFECIARTLEKRMMKAVMIMWLLCSQEFQLGVHAAPKPKPPDCPTSYGDLVNMYGRAQADQIYREMLAH